MLKGRIQDAGTAYMAAQGLSWRQVQYVRPYVNRIDAQGVAVFRL